MNYPDPVAQGCKPISEVGCFEDVKNHLGGLIEFVGVFCMGMEMGNGLVILDWFGVRGLCTGWILAFAHVHIEGNTCNP